MKVNITYIISNIDKALAFEWIAFHLNKSKFQLNFILLNAGNSVLENYLRENNIQTDRITYTGKKDIPKAILKTLKILRKHKSNIVHTHLFDASIIGLTAAWLAGIPKRIHTRHHSNYHHIYFPNAVKWDKLINHFSTDIVAISKVVQTILIQKEQVPSKKVHLIHHGFQLEDFHYVASESVNNIQLQYNPNHRSPVIGVISRYTEWKGIQYIIPAFTTLLKQYPNALLVLANANGDYREEIKKMLQPLPANSYIEIAFEKNIFALYKLFNILIHVPITNEMEAFGQTYVEGLAAQVPAIFTLSGIANEFIKDRDNALVVPHQNSDSIYKAMEELLENSELRSNLAERGQKDVDKMFGLKKMILSLEGIYGY